MSGGVDSSVSALLLQKAGYEVVGVFIKVWQADFLPCNWREERRDAMRAAAHIGIPLLTLDLEKEYKSSVIDYMIEEYGAGRVPNPDVMCNKHVKFGAFLDFARRSGADMIATGHYARIQKSKNGHRLLAGIDRKKDQSYFLWTLTEEQLSHTIFPVGDKRKEEVRRIAKRSGLPNAEKKDSQGLCFLGKIDMSDFLRHYLKTTAGPVVDEEGNAIGTHDGAMLYAIGQRHGFTTEKSGANDSPHFVIKKDIVKNTITVSREDRADKEKKVRGISIEGARGRWGNDPKGLKARIRYRGELFPLEAIERSGERGKAVFADLPEAISSGQSVVFYRANECLGGGHITSVVTE